MSGRDANASHLHHVRYQHSRARGISVRYRKFGSVVKIAGPFTMAAAVAMPAFGQQTGEREQPLILDQIEVEGGTIESAAQSAIRQKKEAPNAVEVIGDDQLQQYNEQALGDALRRVPSITFDGANRAREIRLRGLPSQYTQVLVNGRPLIDGESNRTIEVDRIPTGLVERVEVIRSPRASQRGQGAAGTVNIVLKNGAELPEETEITVGGGLLEENGELGEAGITHTGQIGRLSYTLAGSLQQFRRSESADTFEFDGSGAPDGGALETNERRFEQANLTPQFELEAGPLGTLEFAPFYLWTKEFRTDIETDLEDDQRTVDRISDEDRERVRENYGFRAGWTKSLTLSTELSLGLDWQQGEVDTDRDETRVNADGSLDRARQRTEFRDLELIRPEAVVSTQIQRHEISVGTGIELKEHGETNSEIVNGVLQDPREDRVFDVEEDVFFGFAEDVWAITDRITLTSGLRLEDSETETTNFFGETTSEDAAFLLPSANVVFSATPELDFRAGVARTLRRPDLRSLTPSVDLEDGTAADPDEQGNPNQEPESIWGFDAGVDYYFYDNNGYLSLNVFHRLFSDKIEQVIQSRNGRFVSRPRNVGDGRATGAEVSGRVPLTEIGFDNVTLWGNAVYTDTSVDEPGGGSRRFLNQPDWSGNLGVDYYVPVINTTFGVSVNHVASVDQTQSLSGGGFLEQSIDSRTRFDLSARAQIAENLTLSFTATNLFAETEDREAKVFDSSGALDSVEQESEPTYQQVFVRLEYRF